jgi:TPR repeat protein
MNFHKALILFLTLYLSFPAIANEDTDKGYAAYKEKDYQTAITWFNKAAEQGDANAQYNLGIMYVDGLGVKKDYLQAATWYRKAAKQGHASARYNLGVMYENGQGVKKDYVQAIAWYRKAAEQGQANAQYNLAFMYKNGQGVKKDYVQAVAWYRKAANQGHASARYNLGVMYYGGQGTEKDDIQAVTWFRKGAEQGDARAQSLLGFMYEFGEGVEKDLQKALSLYKKANTKESNERYVTLYPIVQCFKNAKTKVFKTALKCTDRDSLMAAVKNAGAKVNKEDKNNWGDTYFTSDLLKGSSELTIEYTVDDFFAKASYTFPSRMDSGQVTKVRDFVSNKYGAPQSSSGKPSLGKVTYKWTLDDGIELKVSRGWPDTTTYLSYIYPENYQAMVAEQERQKKEKQAKQYEAQNNAF